LSFDGLFATRIIQERVAIHGVNYFRPTGNNNRTAQTLLLRVFAATKIDFPSRRPEESLNLVQAK
jgi:hypothetical protein